MAFSCPYAVRKNTLPFLVCKLLYTDESELRTADTAIKAFCANQRLCRLTQRAENTQGAYACYEYHRAEKEREVEARGNTYKGFQASNTK